MQLTGSDMQHPYGAAFLKVVDIVEKDVFPNVFPKAEVYHQLDHVVSEYRRLGYVVEVVGRQRLEDFRQRGKTRTSRALETCASFSELHAGAAPRRGRRGPLPIASRQLRARWYSDQHVP